MEYDKLLRIERLLTEMNDRLKRIEGRVFHPPLFGPEPMFPMIPGGIDPPKPLFYKGDAEPMISGGVDPPKPLFKKPSVGWESNEKWF